MGWRIVVRHPCHATTEPIFVTKNGYGDMVLMSMETYEAKMQMLEIHTKLAQAEEQIRAGQVRLQRTPYRSLQRNKAVIYHDTDTNCKALGFFA